MQFKLSDLLRSTKRAVRKIIPTWYFSPLRRLAQLCSLALFVAMILFLSRPDSGRSPAATQEAERVDAGSESPESSPTGGGAFHSAGAVFPARFLGVVPAESFLVLDPLVGLSAAVAGRTWTLALLGAAAVLLASVLVPRAFCGYVCPMGTLIDLFDWAVGKRTSKLHVRSRGRWAHTRFYLLAAVLASSAAGVMLAGLVAAIPQATRGVSGVVRLLSAGGGVWYLPLALFLIVLCLGLFGPRFWCRFVCPTGALISSFSLLRLVERRVDPRCISCGRCRRLCSFGAVREDFTTSWSDCTLCWTCAGACPVQAVEFVSRWRPRKPGAAAGAAGLVALSRRGLILGAAGGVAAAFGVRRFSGLPSASPERFLPVRPPGSVPERQFLRTCVRCGECISACPTGLLRPMKLEGGLDGLLTPRAVADGAACHPECNRCGRVCPTGAVLSLPLDQKRSVRMGRASVNVKTCLPHSGRQECGLCESACADAGYEAIGLEPLARDEEGEELMAPVVNAEKCVGCGACQAACYSVNVVEKRLLKEPAISVEAGPGREFRPERAGQVAEALRSSRHERRMAAEVYRRT